MFRKCHVWSSKDHAELLNAGFSGLICIPGIFFFYPFRNSQWNYFVRKDLVFPALMFLLNIISFRALMVSLV